MKTYKAIATMLLSSAMAAMAMAQQPMSKAMAEQRLDSTKRVLDEQREVFEKAQEDYMKAVQDYTQEELKTNTDATYKKLQEVREMLAEIGKAVSTTTKRIAVEAQTQVNDSIVKSVKDTIVVKATDLSIKLGEAIIEGLNKMSSELEQNVRKEQEARENK